MTIDIEELRETYRFMTEITDYKQHTYIAKGVVELVEAIPTLLDEIERLREIARESADAATRLMASNLATAAQLEEARHNDRIAMAWLADCKQAAAYEGDFPGLVAKIERLRAALAHAAKIFAKIKTGSEIEGRWLDEETDECRECYDPNATIEGAYWAPYSDEEQLLWLDGVAVMAEEAEKKCREALGEQS